MRFERLYGVIGVLWVVARFAFDCVFATERMYRTTGLYMTRYYPLGWVSRLLGNTGLFPNLYVQHFHQSDDPVPHNHPRWFFSFILRGGYREVIRKRPIELDGMSTWKLVRRRLPGGSNVIPPSRYHYIQLIDRKAGCWSVCLVGPTLGRTWGFWVNGKHVDSRTYKERLARS